MTWCGMAPELCRVCEGNGVVKIPGGTSVCDHCSGMGYEPPSSADREALARLTAALDAYFAAKGNDLAWVRTVNALMRALAEARRALAQTEEP
jgi:hypothetical protein